MTKIITFLVFLAALIYVVLPPSPEVFQVESKTNELHFWGIYDLPEVYSPIIEVFQKKHPNLRVIYKQFSNPAEYQDVLMRQLEKGKGPDIFLFPDTNRAEVVSYINPTSVEHATGFPTYLHETLTTNRLLFGLPLWADSLVLYYSKRYFPEGISSNWHEFAKQTQEISIGGVAMGRLDNIRSGWDILKALMLQKGVKVSGKPENNLFDTLEFFARFAYPIDPYFNWNESLNKNYPDAEIDSFAREKIAAIAGYASLYNFLLTKSDQLSAEKKPGIDRDQIGVATFPQFSDDGKKYLGKFYFLTVSLHSKYPNEAWEFIRLLTNETNAEYYGKMTGRTPGRILTPDPGEPELQRVQKEQLPNVFPFQVTLPAQQKIEAVVNRAVKDKRVLREILDEEL
jgi:ABC-type glycerol-3-phosphate transport system substrate-binding protein